MHSARERYAPDRELVRPLDGRGSALMGAEQARRRRRGIEPERRDLVEREDRGPASRVLLDGPGKHARRLLPLARPPERLAVADERVGVPDLARLDLENAELVVHGGSLAAGASARASEKGRRGGARTGTPLLHGTTSPAARAPPACWRCPRAPSSASSREYGSAHGSPRACRGAGPSRRRSPRPASSSA